MCKNSLLKYLVTLRFQDQSHLFLANVITKRYIPSMFRLFIPALALLLSSCIQIPVGFQKTERYEKISFKKPRGFNDISKDLSGDRTWINPQNGALIGFKSECSSIQSSPDVFLQTITGAFGPHTVLEEKSFSYNLREAVRKVVESKIEGISTKMDLIAFNKFGCSFILSHVARSQFFEQDQNTFENFVSSFRVKR